MTKTLLFIFMFIIMLFSVNATDYFRVGETFDIKVFCENDGTGGACGTNSRCNLSLTGKDGIVVNNLQMSNNNYFHNYTITNTSLQTGEYDSVICCVDGNETGCITNSVVINNIGSNSDTAVYVGIIMLAIFLFLSLVLTVFFYSQESMLKYLFLILDFIIPACICYMAFLFPSNINPSIGNLFMVFGHIFAVLSGIVAIIVVLEITLLGVKKISEATKRKEREEWGYELT